MKEAAGEANMTVITIVLIAIVLGVGIILVPNLMGKTAKSTCCTDQGYIWHEGECYKKCTIDDSTGKISSCTDSVTPSCNGTSGGTSGGTSQG